MLAVTSFMTIDLAPVPLLWALPLSLYLLSFVVAFSATERAQKLHRAMVFVLPGVAIGLSILLLVRAREPLWVVMPLHLLSFGVVALVCHGELARDRPAAGELTSFYLLVAVGGALGGVVTGILVPAVFETLPEYALTIVAACLCLPKRAPRVPPSKYVRWLDFGLPVAVGLLVLAALALDQPRRERVRGRRQELRLRAGGGHRAQLRAAPAALRAGGGRDRARRLGAAARGGDRAAPGPQLLRGDPRGALRRRPAQRDDPRHHHPRRPAARPRRRRTPLTYFHPTGPAGQIMSATRSRRTAIIGLGTGSLACYARPGDHWTFYELDPTVERIARDTSLFTYLRDCDGRFDVVQGDARLSLERARTAEYGLLVADAFSSDAIPTHLLTREAVRLYRRKLRPDGVVAFHVSNRFLDLEPVLGEVARSERLACLTQNELRRPNPPRGKSPSHWVVMAARQVDLGPLAADPRWRQCRRTPGRDAWSDDFSSPVSALGGPGSG